MKILLATSMAIPTGGGIASYNQELQRTFGADNDLYLLTDENESNVYGYKKTFSTYSKPVFSFVFCREAIDKINAAGFDLIVNSNSSIMPLIVPYLLAPVISVSHFVDGRLSTNAGYNHKYQNAIVSLSKSGKRYLERRFRIGDANMVKVVYNFVGDAVSTISNKKESASKLTIVYPGATSPKKSVDVVIEFLYKLLATDLDFNFVWIGGTILPSANRSLFGIRSLEDLFSDRRVSFVGRVSREESVSIISSANIFLLPSRGEGCPISLIEAMRTGCVPIVSDVPHGGLDIIEASRCGVVVPQGDATRLLETVVDIIRNHSKYVFNYNGTREFFHSNLSETRWKREMFGVIEDSVLKEKKVKPLTRFSFFLDKMGYCFLLSVNRVMDIFLSAFIRVRIDYFFLKYSQK